MCLGGVKEFNLRGHQAGSDVCAGHLDADDRLRFVRAEMLRRRVDEAGINGRAAEADHHEPRKRNGCAKRQEQKDDAAGNPSYFSKQFRRFYQCAPREYRNGVHEPE